MDRLLNDVWDESYLYNMIDIWSLQVQTSQTDSSYDDKVLELKNWVYQRRGLINDALSNGLLTGENDPSNQCHN